MGTAPAGTTPGAREFLVSDGDGILQPQPAFPAAPRLSLGKDFLRWEPAPHPQMEGGCELRGQDAPLEHQLFSWPSDPPSVSAAPGSLQPD